MTKQTRILIAEDDFDIRELYQEFILKCLGHGIIIDEVDNGDEEVNLAKNHEYQLIISDGNMKGMDGITAAHTIRGLGINTPIVMFSALRDLEKEAIRRGITEFYRKPIDPRDIEDVLKKDCMG